ncbi:hypothetical protein [Terricaulis silvestris]|uniref:hypothetical protein n=1 Tax=Terricaulis silvestris TaxID=2686094 RepID=UPI001E521761|nr:hypothetical protein [Terricaulis silvestris]
MKSSRLAMSAMEKSEFIVDRSIRLTRPDRERFEGKVQRSRGSAGGGSANGGKLIDKLANRLKQKTPRAGGTKVSIGAMSFDRRQRAVVKVHYFAHGGGGGAALKAHTKYVARDAAARDGLSSPVGADEAKAPDKEKAKAHADYLDRGGKRGIFYDTDGAHVDGAGRVERWAASDRRHFRIILSAEEGGRLRDLPGYTREVMARAGAALGTKLSWIAVDHHDTDNAHTHIILRGRRANGQDLVLPRDFIKHGFRSLARDVATEWLGERTPEQERRALAREAFRHGPTRLDPIIAAQAHGNVVRVAELAAPNGDPSLTQAVKARVRELERLGLAQEIKRNVFALSPDWHDRLKAMELHLDIRKRIVRERVERGLIQQRPMPPLPKGLMDR